MTTTAPAPLAAPQPNVGDVFGHAWPLLERNFWPLMGCILLVMGIQLPAYMISFAASAVPADAKLAALLLNFMSQGYSIFVGLPAQYGLYRVGARVAQGHAPDAMDVVWGYRSLRAYFTVIGSTFVLGLVMIAAMAPAIVILLVGGCGAVLAAAEAGKQQDTAAAMLAVGFGVLFLAFLAMLPAIWLSLRLMFVQTCVAEADAGPVQALSWSWALTRGHALTVLAVALCGGLILCAGFLACCVGIIPAMGFFALLQGSLYVALRAHLAPPPAPLPSPDGGAPAT